MMYQQFAEELCKEAGKTAPEHNKWWKDVFLRHNEVVKNDYAILLSCEGKNSLSVDQLASVDVKAFEKERKKRDRKKTRTDSHKRRCESSSEHSRGDEDGEFVEAAVVKKKKSKQNGGKKTR